MKGRHFIIPIITATLCWLFYLFTSDLYLFTDNIGVAVVLNGFYSNPLSQYQHPLFCLFVYGLSKLFPSADMYCATIHFLVFSELTILMAILSPRKPLKKWKLQDYLLFTVSVLLCIFLSAGLNLWRANYTITAASLLFTGWLVLAFFRDMNRPLSIKGTVFIAFSYMLRKEAGLLFIPFIVLMLIAEGITSRRMSVIKRYLPACAVILFLFASQTIFNSIEPFSTAKRYNDARTVMVDFPVMSWNVDLGVSREDYDAAVNWLFSDTEVMNVDILEKTSEENGRNEYELSADGFRGALNNMRRIIWKTDVYMSVMAILCVMLTVWNIVTQESGWLKIIAIVAVIGAFIILLYFTFRGRAPLRVWQPVLFGVLFLELALIIIGNNRQSSMAQSVFLLLVSIALYYSAGQVVAHAEFHSPCTVLTARTDADDSAYAQTFQDDDLYIWPNWHAEIPEYFGKIGKLPTQRVLEHNIALGDWTSGQPYFTEFLERVGHPNPIKDLVEKDNVYIMSNSNYILNFLRLHYGEDIELVAAGEVNGKTSYRVVHAKSAE